MTEKFETELARLQQETRDMGTYARTMLSDAIKALLAQDNVLAESVHERKALLRDRYHRIEDDAYQILTLYQPVAKDMRTVVSCLKVASALERIGRYGKDIATVVGYLGDSAPISNFLSIPQMARSAERMIGVALAAFQAGDLDKVEGFSVRDDEVDALGYSIFRECVTYMIEDPTTITRCANYVMVARYLERSADRACTIAEATVFMQTGERVEIK
jgi:phosphate transport system protein